MKKLMYVLLCCFLILGVTGCGTKKEEGKTDSKEKETAYSVEGEANAWSGFNDGLTVLSRGDKFGVVDKTGKIVVDFEYDYISPFNNGYATISVKDSRSGTGERYGIIDKKGKVVVDLDSIGRLHYSEGLIAISSSYKYGYQDVKGNMVIDYQFDDAGEFHDGLAAVEKNDKWGYIDKDGKVVIDYQFDGAEEFSDGLAAVEKDDKWGYIDKTGKVVIDYQFDFSETFADGLLMKLEKSNDIGYSMKCFDKTGKVVIEANNKYYDVDNFAEGLAPVADKDGKWGYIDKKGKLVIDCQYDSASSFSDGLARVKKDGKIGYINSKNKVVIDFIYDEGNSFSEDLAYVRKENDSMFIDKKGKTILSLK